MLSPFLTSLVAALYLGEKMEGGAWAWAAGFLLVAGGLCLLWAQNDLPGEEGTEASIQEPQLSSSGEGSSPASG